jgi:hypothetical protein
LQHLGDEPPSPNQRWFRKLRVQYERQLPLIAGTDTDFSYPYVLTANSTGINLNVTMLTGGNGIIETGQYWGRSASGCAWILLAQ